ncbi:ubiquitin-associated (UBA)/TS-N domain-containing protein [Actinidia rufa]|uniref:Ubiquitin-associated (UBA)/TS-N domain-containing protein n=1 Tax=Actinidia rufa TaxID=165716 RepID=A0A7J0FYU3_9ERIC|nr:ubiquitin-associated (UBA)/TS-N domain-containing protein [Actinidia rufa]
MTTWLQVKYGETLRRFNACVNEAGQLDLGICGLREKVLGLFDFAPDADCTLTYIDEDGDVVTLVDEEDIFNARSTGNSTPTRSPSIQHPLPLLKSSVSELLKSVPEPFRGTLSNMSLDVTSKATSSSPEIADLINSFSKIGTGQLCIGPFSAFLAGSESSTQSGASGSAMGAPMTKETEGSRDDGPTSVVLPNAMFEEPTSKANQKGNSVNSTRGLDAVVTPVSGPLNLNADLPGDSLLSGSECANLAPVVAQDGAGDSKEDVEYGKADNLLWANIKAVTSSVLASDSSKDAKKSGEGWNFLSSEVFQCDGCGVHPITGLRFKSTVKDNYDLCNACFSKMGNEADYIRMDHPVSGRRLYSFKGQYDPMQQSRMRPPRLPHHLMRACGVKPSGLKLNSRFITDVNVLDGNREHSFVGWGDKLSVEASVELQISADGLPVENELDVAVDFTAPEHPGRYISYWRMASPSGQKFGQRVWVLIQVDASWKDSLCDSIQGLNLNLPPVESMNVNIEPMVEDSLPVPHNSESATNSVEPLVDANAQDLNFPINDTLLVGSGVSNTVPPEVPPTSVSFPITQLASAVPSHESSPSASTVVLASVEGTSENKDVEQNLLRELEEMGFKQVDLNKEILRLNEYDLEQSLDDLCGVAEWDPILEELQEMGFCDEEMNKKLLKKNGGSIKRVVMDLITGEKL